MHRPETEAARIAEVMRLYTEEKMVDYIQYEINKSVDSRISYKHLLLYFQCLLGRWYCITQHSV